MRKSLKKMTPMKKTIKNKGLKKKPRHTTRRNHIFREKMIKKFNTIKLRCSPKTAGKK